MALPCKCKYPKYREGDLVCGLCMRAAAFEEWQGPLMVGDNVYYTDQFGNRELYSIWDRTNYGFELKLVGSAAFDGIIDVSYKQDLEKA